MHHLPSTKWWRPSSVAARATSPASSARRIAVDDTAARSPCASATILSITATAKPCRSPGLDEEGRRARPALAEVEVVAHHGRRDAEPAHQHVRHEVLGAERREAGVEAAHHHAVDRAEPAQRQRLGGRRRDAEDRGRAREIVARMRLEGQHRRGPAELGRQRLRPADHGLVAAVHAVEIADRHHGPGEARGRALGVLGDDEVGRERRDQAVNRGDAGRATGGFYPISAPGHHRLAAARSGLRRLAARQPLRPASPRPGSPLCSARAPGPPP